MRRLALSLVLVAAPVALAGAQSPAQREAQQQVARDQAEDRVDDAARELSAGGRVGSPPLLEDLNRDRLTPTPERLSTPGISARTVPEASLPLLSDNPQR